MDIKEITQDDKETLKKNMEEREERDRKDAEEREESRRMDMRDNPVKYMAMAGIKKRFLSATLKEIKLPARIVRITTEFFESDGGLFLTGDVGSGKTYLACAIARDLIIEGHRVLFITAPNLFQDIRATFGKDKAGEQRIINKYSKVEYLIIDDLGSEKQTDFSLDRLYLIINNRYSEMLSSIITSNLSLDEIKEKIHDRISSRIAGSCRVIIMPKIDLRLTNKRR